MFTLAYPDIGVAVGVAVGIVLGVIVGVGETVGVGVGVMVVPPQAVSMRESASNKPPASINIRMFILLSLVLYEFRMIVDKCTYRSHKISKGIIKNL